MTSVNSIRLPGLATGMDTDNMVKEMLSGEQKKLDRVKQKEQSIKWQQEIYREVIKDIKGFQDNYFSATSKNSIISSKAWNTLTVSSSNENVISATGSAGANKIDYKFNVTKLAESAKLSFSKSGMTEDTTLGSLTLSGEKKFSIKTGDDKISKEITIGIDDTVETLTKKINDASNGEFKASYSEMTGTFTIESSKTGVNSKVEIVDSSNPNAESDALSFLFDKNKSTGTNSVVNVMASDGIKVIKTLNEESNSFSIDGINYNVNSIGTAELTSKQDVEPVVTNMKKFVEDYNKIMDKVYNLMTEKTNKDYPPLTEAQKEDMSDEEIEKWDKKAKVGLLRNDSDMRSFMDHMQNAIFGENVQFLNEAGLTSNEDYTKKGQLSLNEDKFRKALQNDGDKVYKAFTKDKNGMLEKMKDTMYDYVGSSTSVFAKKAGLEKTSSVVKNFYSEELKRQEDIIKKLQRKMDNKESRLYKQFGQLEASMNKLNSQMNYFSQM